MSRDVRNPDFCSENKGADQLRGYREADLRLCFRIRKNPVFSRRAFIFAYAKKQLFHDAAHIQIRKFESDRSYIEQTD